ncbi:hypothetical protein C8R43DRAFT_930247 [Mycena crocata]|nr:hypothetical protein C8R43DRAFT_930247 [Mycena crocata]
MYSRRAQTLETLATFIEQQKALLARTQSDLETLRSLQADTVADVASLAEQLSGKTFRLSEQVDCQSQVPQSIDWELFAQKDPKPLQNFALTARTTYAERNKPSTIQRSELSELQKFVKEARRTIVDPVLALFDDQPDEEEATNTPESPKDAKKLKHDACAALKIPRVLPRGPSGLFTRRTFDIDMDLDTTASTTAVDSESTRGPSSSTTSPLCRSSPSPKALPMALAKPVRTRRISTKLQHQNLDRSEALVTRSRRKSSAATAKREPSLEPIPEPEPEPEPEKPPSPPPTVLGKRARKVSTTKPDTYKVMWSASEQNLLERLLEEIPQEDPRRYSKISVAMNGRRTPRQVSSRVQKYLQKLKKFGVESQGK